MIANATAHKDASNDRIENAGELSLLKTAWVLVAGLLAIAPFGPARADFDTGLTAFGEGRLDDARTAWHQSASEGHEISQYLLAELYEAGTSAGSSADMELAHRWYCAAASGGYEGAAGDCSRLAELIQRARTDDNASLKADVATTENVLAANLDSDADQPVSSEAAAGLPDTTTQLAWMFVDPVVNPDELLTLPPLSVEEPDAADNVTSLNVIESEVLLMQQLLNQLGHDVGKADGLMGRNTRLAVLAFKKQVGLEVNDKIDDEALRAVRQQIAQNDAGLPSAANESETGKSSQSAVFGDDW